MYYHVSPLVVGMIAWSQMFYHTTCLWFPAENGNGNAENWNAEMENENAENRKWNFK